MTHSESCIFCKICTKEIPADIFYENDVVVAFLDIHPHSKGHALIVPRKHSASLLEMSPADTATLYKEVSQVLHIMQKTLTPKGANITSNAGREAGQIIFHTHVHIIPRYDDGHSHAYTYKECERELTLEALRSQAMSH